MVSGTSYGLAFEPVGNGTTTVSVAGPAGVQTMSSSGHRQVTISQPGLNMSGTPTVGAGLMLASGASLGASQHGGVVVTVASSDPSRVLVSPTASDPGVASFTRTVANGQVSVPYMLHGLEGATGNATVTVSAPGFTSGTHTVVTAPIGVEIQSLPANLTTLSPSATSWYVQVGLPCSGNTTLCSTQNRRAGAPALVFSLTVTGNTVTGAPVARLHSDEPAASGSTVTKPIQAGSYYTQAVPPGSAYGLVFEPLGSGTATVTVTGPAGVQRMSTSGTRQVSITGPAVNAPGTNIVGAGLIAASGTSLGASQHGGVTVTIQSSDPSRVLVSPDAATVGTASFTRSVANGSTSVPYYVHGLENVTGTATVTISAPGFTPASGTVTVAPAGVEIQNLSASTTNLSADSTQWYVQVGLPCSGNATLCSIQSLRPGAPAMVVTLTNSNGAVARLRSDEPAASGQVVTKPIQPGIYYSQASATGTSYGLAFEPLGNGSTTVTASGPGGVLTMTSTGRRTVTVATPGISTTATATVGAGLQTNTGASLGAPQHGGVTVTISSSAPSVVQVAASATAAGSGSLAIPVANGTTGFGYYIQGVEGATGTAVITISAPGFTSATTTVTVVAPAVEIQGLPASTTAAAADAAGWYVQIGIPDSTGTYLTHVQNVRAGSPGIVITLSNGNAAVAQLRSDEPAAVGQTVTKPIVAGRYYTGAVTGSTSYGLAFDPLAAGTTTVTATPPPGIGQTSSAVRTVVVNP